MIVAGRIENRIACLAIAGNLPDLLRAIECGDWFVARSCSAFIFSLLPWLR